MFLQESMKLFLSSGDSTARIWTIADGPSGNPAYISAPKPLVLKHFKGKTNEKSKDVTTLDWNASLPLRLVNSSLCAMCYIIFLIVLYLYMGVMIKISVCDLT